MLSQSEGGTDTQVDRGIATDDYVNCDEYIVCRDDVIGGDDVITVNRW